MESYKPDEVVAAIEKAFAKVQLGGGISLHEADVIDDHGTVAQQSAARRRDQLRWHDWRQIPDDELAGYQSLIFMDAEGLRFHLPACLSYAIRHYQEDSGEMGIDSTLHTLRAAGRFAEMFALLDAPQRAAVSLFLQFVSHHGLEEADRKAAQRAYETYWKPAE